MQCKDIPDKPVLAFLASLPVGSPGTWFWSDDYKPNNSVIRAMPDGTPAKLGRVKMQGLIKRGLVNGCACGCRGNFEVTDKGRQMVEQG